MTNHDVVKKLIGNICPQGESHIDGERHENLKEAIKLIDSLMYDMYDVAECSKRHEGTMKRSGNLALNYLRNLCTEINEQFGDGNIDTQPLSDDEVDNAADNYLSNAVHGVDWNDLKEIFKSGAKWRDENNG